MIDVWSQYQSKDSSFKVYETPIKEFPTLTLCTGPYSNYRYEFDLTISYDDTRLKLGRNQIVNGDNSTETLSLWLDKVYTFYSGTCYKIFSHGDINYSRERGFLSYIHIEFNDMITFNNLPDVLEFYITSARNSVGIIYNDWRDGEELALKFEKVIM